MTGDPSKPLEQEVDLFELANLYPRTTGLPMTIWVSPKGRAQHDVRIKVCRKHGNRMDISDTAEVSVRPLPKDLNGALPSADFALVERWIVLNSDALIDYWNGDLDTVELGLTLKRLP